MNGLWREQRSVRLAPGDERRLILALALLMVGAHLLFRAWLLFPAHFYEDDFILLAEGRQTSLDLAYLFSPYNGHPMPLGRLIAWLVGQTGLVSWTLAAGIILGLQALAALSAVWMLVVLFTVRWAVLAPLLVYLTTALTVPSFTWWAAALTFVGFQLAFFLAVGAWTRYLRERTGRWLGATVGAVALGLLVWVQALLLVGVLAYVAVAYFGPRLSWGAPWLLLRRYWLGAVLVAALCVPYVAFWVSATPEEVFSRPSGTAVLRLVEAMWGTTFATGALGGPWEWTAPTPPVALAAPPELMGPVAWSCIAAVVIVTALSRRNTLRGWALLLGYLVVSLSLLVSSTAFSSGALTGLDPRHLADAALVLVLVLGLVTMELRGAPGSSRPRARTILTRGVLPVVVGIALALAGAGGVFSAVRHASYWHQDGAGPYIANIQRQLGERGTVELAPQTLPANVISPLGTPHNTTEFLMPLITDKVTFPDASDELLVLDPSGAFRTPVIRLGLASEPGPDEGCGWRVAEDEVTIPLGGRTFDYSWWLRVGYLSNGPSPVTVSAGGDSVQAQVRPGLHDLFVRLEGTFDEVELSGLQAGTVLCVDRIEVGDVVPGGAS